MKTFIALAVAAVLTTWWAVSEPGAEAGQCGYEYCWGAVGIGPGGAYGYAHSHFSEADAYNAAMQGCGWDCNLVRTFYNTCGAIAQASNGGWGWGYAPSRAAAEGLALGYCSENGPNCQVRVWACSP